VHLIDELKRRKVVRVAVVYAATAFVVLQAADLLAAGLRLPEWVFPVVTVLLVLGFPVALVLGWALELTPEGIRRTEATPASAQPAPNPALPAPSLLGRRTVLLAGALVLLGIGLSAGWFLRPGSQDQEYLGDGGAVDDRSLAVLPFADLSEAGDQKWFADGLAEEILTSLARHPELRVIGRSSSFLFAGNEGLDDRRIADTLGVAHLVKGSVRRASDQVRVTAQLVRAADGVHLWSEPYDRGTADLLDVQRDVAEKVAAALDVLLDDERRERMFAAGTRSVEAFEAYLRGRELFVAAHTPGTTVTLAEANEWLGRAMALDPGFGQPALLYADRYAHLVVDGSSQLVGPHDLSREQALERLRRALDHAARGARDPQARIAADINRVFFSSNWQRLPALLDELRTRVAADQQTFDDPWGRYAPLITGRLELVRELGQLGVQADPLNAFAWDLRILAELAAGDLQAVRTLITELQRAGSSEARQWEAALALYTGDRRALLDLFDGLRGMLPMAVRGDTAAALAAALAFEERQGLQPRLLDVYHTLGDDERLRDVARRIDALPAGPVLLARYVSLNGMSLTFDPADTPNFAARLREAGVDPASLRRRPGLQ
jgi:TolB-like protein